MEISSYLVNPRSTVNAHVLYTVRRNLTQVALALDKRARTFRVGISHRKGWLGTLEQPQEFPIEVDLLDAAQVSLLSYYHDFDRERYEELSSKLSMLVEQYLDAEDYSTSVVSSMADIVSEQGVLPRAWLQRIIPRIRGMTVKIGGDSEHEIPLVARRSRANPRIWELACDITETVKEVRFETDLYPELSHYTKTYNAVQDSALQILADLFERGAIVEDNVHKLFLREWGFVSSRHRGVYVLSWSNSKITDPSGGAVAFAEKIQRECSSHPGALPMPYHCADNDHSRHFLARVLLQMGYGAPLFHKGRVIIPTRSYSEASMLASAVRVFSISGGGLRNAGKMVEAMPRVNSKQPPVFAAANADQKSAYLSLDSQNIYVYSLAEE